MELSSDYGKKAKREIWSVAGIFENLNFIFNPLIDHVHVLYFLSHSRFILDYLG